MAEASNSSDGPPPPDRDPPASPARRRTLRSPGEALQPDAAPPPPAAPRRARPIVATVSGVLSFLGIAAVALVVLVSLGLQRIDAPGPLPADKVVLIAPGTDVGDIVGQLQGEGVIDSGTLMTGTLYLEGSRRKIKAGEYLFKQSASLRDVIDTLVSGRQILHSVTIPEGLTSEQICDRLKDNDILTGDIKTVPKEGTVMPNTFKFARGTTREQLLRSMAQDQKRIVAEVWAHRAQDTPIRSPYDMVTLASIVEKETGKADERPLVAGVFINRLVKNIPLQSDPTIVYGLVGGKATLGRGILRSEIEQRTPYNTYAVSGLPPGPICNPGRAAMEAVANPSHTKDIYFVADGTGGHAFAETLDQHRQNVQRWRQIEKDAKDRAPDADRTPAPSPASGTASPRQRGDAAPSVPIYGALTGHFDAAPPPGQGPVGLLVGVTQPPIVLSVHDIVASHLVPFLPGQAASLDPDGPGDPAPETPAYGSGEERALAYAGDGDPRAGAARPSSISFPVSAAQRADERARAAHFGMPTGSDTLPLDASRGAPDDEAGPPQPPGAAAAGRTPGRSRVTDASEGTRLDPLLDKTYDLNTAKTIPASVMSAARGGPVP